MFKLAAIIGGVLLLAGVALAGTVTSLGSAKSPTVGLAQLPAVSTPRQDDRGHENELRGRENEPRENEPAEDLRGPCDEAEHANDPRCGAAAVAPRVALPDDHRGRVHGERSGRRGGEDGHSSGHRGHGGDD